MSEVPSLNPVESPTRRHFFSVIAAVAGSLPFITFSSQASASGPCGAPPGSFPSPECVCYLRGTQIRTPVGERRIEELVIGDLVETARGDQRPIKWIGRQRFRNAIGSDWQECVMPVRISRFALDDQAPRKDLYLSPAHSLFIDGVLIPAIHLVNGTSIVQVMPEGVEEIDYFHIELETHQVIFAEGALAETLLVTSDREMFDNFVEYERLYGSAERQAMTPYAPIARYDGGRSELRALFRRLTSTIVDVRDPIQVAYDRIADRAQELVKC
jgi:Hint domain